MHAWKTHLLLIAILAAPLTVLANCPDIYEVPSDQGKAWLGLCAGGFIAGEGQSFHLECSSLLVTVSFEIILDGQNWYGVPPLGAGDMLYCEIRTLSGVTLLSTSRMLDFDVGQRWIIFDFSGHSFELIQGDYLIACYPAFAKQARLAYHQSSDLYSEGIRYISENGGAGPWLPADPVHGDLAFQVIALGTVPAESAAWGQVKALYR